MRTHWRVFGTRLWVSSSTSLVHILPALIVSHLYILFTCYRWDWLVMTISVEISHVRLPSSLISSYLLPYPISWQADGLGLSRMRLWTWQWCFWCIFAETWVFPFSHQATVNVSFLSYSPPPPTQLHIWQCLRFISLHYTGYLQIESWSAGFVGWVRLWETRIP
jgi:hypothetical protein